MTERLVLFFKRNLWTIVAASVLIGVIIYQRIPLWEAQSRVEGRPAPEFVVINAEGEPFEVNQQTFQGKITVLSFWATWCVPCKVESPILESLYSEMQGKPFQMFAISGEQIELVQGYSKEKGLVYPVFVDSTSEVHNLYGVRGYPTIIVIDQHGRIDEMSMGIDFLVKWKVGRMVESLAKGKETQASFRM